MSTSNRVIRLIVDENRIVGYFTGDRHMMFWWSSSNERRLLNFAQYSRTLINALRNR